MAASVLPDFAAAPELPAGAVLPDFASAPRSVAEGGAELDAGLIAPYAPDAVREDFVAAWWAQLPLSASVSSSQSLSQRPCGAVPEDFAGADPRGCAVRALLIRDVPRRALQPYGISAQTPLRHWL